MLINAPLFYSRIYQKKVVLDVVLYVFCLFVIWTDRSG